MTASPQEIASSRPVRSAPAKWAVIGSTSRGLQSTKWAAPVVFGLVFLHCLKIGDQIQHLLPCEGEVRHWGDGVGQKCKKPIKLVLGPLRY